MQVQASQVQVQVSLVQVQVSLVQVQVSLMHKCHKCKCSKCRNFQKCRPRAPSNVHGAPSGSRKALTNCHKAITHALAKRGWSHVIPAAVDHSRRRALGNRLRKRTHLC